MEDLDKAQVTFFSFVIFGVKPNKALAKPKSQRFTPLFSTKNFIVSDFMFGSMIHLN